MSVSPGSPVPAFWNDTVRPFPEAACIHELIAEQAGRTPNRRAVHFGGKSHTYEELDRMSSIVARTLAAKGVKRGELVGICIERSFSMVCALLGVLKTGAAYVPLDPYYPQSRLAYMAKDASIKAVVTTREQTPFLSFLPQSVSVVISPDPQTGGKDQSSFAAPKVSAEETAYVIYTSGSTGNPKGVRIPHKAVVNFLFSMRREPGIAPEDIVLAVTTLSFDIAVLEILLPLVCGACTVIVDDATARDGSRLARLVESSGVTIVQGTPATWRLLLASGWKSSPNVKALCGGEPLPRDLVRDLVPIVKELWNMYGPTETTVWSSCCRVSDQAAPVTIGRPIANTTMFIIDDRMNQAPVGDIGELCIGGLGLAEGYHNRPELTAERFTFTPFSNGRIYRTGDLARYRPDGEIECLGRIDTQVKISGHRIETGEIENAILSDQRVRQCAVVCRELSPGDARLLAFYVPSGQGRAPAAAELRGHCKALLPAYMLPHHLFELDHMPLTPAGKIDRKRLDFPKERGTIKKQEPPEVMTPNQAYLAEVWKQELHIDTVRLQDNFFEIGGHSLLSVKVQTRIEIETGVDIHPRAMMLNTLEELAQNHDFGKKPSVPREPAQRKDAKILPLFFGNGTGALFGAYHEPDRASAPARPVLLCSPIGHEYMRSYNIIRQLAEQLAAAGHPVLRFDWFGHGDSMGAPSETLIETWVCNIKIAIEELQKLSRQSPVTIVGLRFGATLACLAARTIPDIKAVVLWDAVVSGKTYLAEVQKLHASFMTKSSSLAASVSNEHEFLGFTYSQNLQKEMSKIDISVLEIPGDCAVRTTTTSAPNTWNDDALWDHVILNNKDLPALVDCVAKEQA
jgi:amino acid adenylation domain-containing protein